MDAKITSIDTNPECHTLASNSNSTTMSNNSSNENVTDSTVFVLVTDQGYIHKAKRTILDLRTRGLWLGDIVLINIDNAHLGRNYLDFYRVTEKKFPIIEEKYELLQKLHYAPFLDSIDGREISKVNQWEKLHVMDPYFRQWDRVVFLDSGLRVLDDVYSTILQLDYRGKFLAPDDGGNYVELPNPNKLFHTQVSQANPSRLTKLKEDFPKVEELLEPYFLNCMWVYDTAILDICTKEEMIQGMLDYPICLTNEMTMMNLFIHFKYGLWERFPVRAHNGKILFDWCEANNPKPSSWRDYCFIKYPNTITFEDT